MDVNKMSNVKEQIKSLLYPETLEVSKVCNILSDELSFKVEDFFHLKEVQTLDESKDNLIQILKEIEKEGIIRLNEDNEVTIVIGGNLTLYNFLNLPNKMNKEQLITLLNLKEGDYKRIYKQSLYWFLVSENEEFINGAEKLLKEIKIENASLKYDISNSKTLRKQIMKQIQHHNYIKETDELKGSPSNPRKDNNSRHQSQNNPEPFSWRKKSDMSTTSKDDNSLIKKDNKLVSAFNSSNSKFVRRERFNSDPHTKEYPSQFISSVKEEEEIIKINPELINYPLIISHKYSIKEMLEFYDKIRESLQKNPTQFRTFVEEVCETKAKDNLTITSPPVLVNSRRNSGDGYKNHQKDDFKSPLKMDKINIPRYNPLQEMNLNK